MRIAELRINGYRCFDRLILKDLGRIVCLVGANGSGKTSILELIDKTIGYGQGDIERFMANSWARPEKERLLQIRLELTSTDIETYGVQPNIRSLLSEERDVNVQIIEYSKNKRSLPEWPREAVVVFPSNRSFLLGASAEAKEEPRSHDWQFYRGTSIRNFQPRADAFAARLAVLVNMKRDRFIKKFKSLKQEEKSLQELDYRELPEVQQVFSNFFGVSGKEYVFPKTEESGQTSFLFRVPWSKDTLPFSALSSGEQWILFFFVEMEINDWANHIILIDEIETHLHPKLAIQFVKALQEREDSNQYWFTTHNPTIAKYLEKYTVGLVLNSDKTAETVSGESLGFLESLTGRGAMIPVAKTLVLLEGSSPSGERYSVDETFFRELQKSGLVDESIDFLSVGAAHSVESFQDKLVDVENHLGSGWSICSIRDRDAMPESKRKELIRLYNNKLYIWERGCIEGYLLNPEVITSLCKEEAQTEMPDEQEIVDFLMKQLRRSKDDIMRRYENYLVISYFPSRSQSTTKWLKEAPQHADKVQKDLSDFKTQVNKWLNEEEWEQLLPYADCKDLLKATIGKYLGQESVPRDDFLTDMTKLFRDAVRAVLNQRESDERPSDLLSDTWPEISEVINCIQDNQGFDCLL